MLRAWQRQPCRRHRRHGPSAPPALRAGQTRPAAARSRICRTRPSTPPQMLPRTHAALVLLLMVPCGQSGQGQPRSRLHPVRHTANITIDPQHSSETTPQARVRGKNCMLPLFRIRVLPFFFQSVRVLESKENRGCTHKQVHKSKHVGYVTFESVRSSPSVVFHCLTASPVSACVCPVACSRFG